MADPERARRMLTELQDNGVRVSIDDFGTGYSSLAWLGRLPVHAVKIDRSFLLEMERDPANGIIVRSTIDLGHSLGLRVVAEGVETTAMRDTLAELGCDAGQGFLWSPAVPGADIENIAGEALNLAA
jgi:EAL domain-containing protein (putative c-di-GMP-specific phosphodiesterase class I)